MNLDSLKNPAKAAAFFAFMEYERGQIVEYLTDRLDVPQGEAERLTDAAIAEHERQETNDAKVAERFERARASEHDLNQTNWKGIHGD